MHITWPSFWDLSVSFPSLYVTQITSDNWGVFQGHIFGACPQEEVYNETCDSWLQEQATWSLRKMWIRHSWDFVFLSDLITMRMCLSLQSGVSILEDTRCVWGHWWESCTFLYTQDILQEFVALNCYGCSLFTFNHSPAPEDFLNVIFQFIFFVNIAASKQNLVYFLFAFSRFPLPTKWPRFIYFLTLSQFLP